MTVVVFDSGGDMELDEGSMHVRGHKVQFIERHGHGVALYQHGNLTYAVTSDLPAEEIVEVIGTSL